MKKIIILIVIIVAFGGIGLNGQSAVENYTKEAIYLKFGFWSPKYVKNGKSYPISIFNSNLQNEMKVSEYAFAEYQKYKKNRNTGIVLGAISSALIVGGSLAVLSSIDERSGPSKNYTYLMLGGFGASLVGAYFTITSRDNLEKAIWLRNRDILDK